MRRSPRLLEKSIAIAARESHWLTNDDPGVILAKRIARKIDDQIVEAERTADGTLFGDAPLAPLEGALTYDSQTLLGILTSLGLTPKGAKEIGIDDSIEADNLGRIMEMYVPAADG